MLPVQSDKEPLMDGFSVAIFFLPQLKDSRSCLPDREDEIEKQRVSSFLPFTLSGSVKGAPAQKHFHLLYLNLGSLPQ